MSRWQEYCEDAVDFAIPYLHKAGQYTEKAVGSARKAVKVTRKKAKREMRLLRFQRNLELIKNLILIAAALIALAGVVKKYLDER